jgi:hypothetical protein
MRVVVLDGATVDGRHKDDVWVYLIVNEVKQSPVLNLLSHEDVEGLDV